MDASVIKTITIKLMVATLFFSSRFMPSLKKVEEGRMVVIYAFSSAVAGVKSSGSNCMLKGL